jgi:hypothetical protein
VAAQRWDLHVLVVLQDVQLLHLGVQRQLDQLTQAPVDLRVPELRSLVVLEIRELFQETADLHDYPEDVLGARLEVHYEAFDRLVVLEHWVKILLFQDLPVLAQIIFVIRVE